MNNFKQCTRFMTPSPLSPPPPRFPSTSLFLLQYPVSSGIHPWRPDMMASVSSRGRRSVDEWYMSKTHPELWHIPPPSYVFCVFFYTAPDTCKETSALHTLPLSLQLKTRYSTLIYSWLIQGKARSLSAIWRLSCSYVHKISAEFKMLSKPE